MSNYLFYSLVLCALVIGYAVQVNPNFDLEAFRNNLTFQEVTLQVAESPDLSNALSSFVNGLGNCMFSIMKWVAQVSYENPTIPFKLLIYLTILSILAPIILVLFKLGVIIFILLKEFIQSRKEKRKYVV